MAEYGPQRECEGIGPVEGMRPLRVRLDGADGEYCDKHVACRDAIVVALDDVHGTYSLATYSRN